MRNALFTATIVTLLAACGGNEAPPNDPSKVTPETAPTEPKASAAPAESAPAAAPAESKCKAGEMPAAAKDYDSCLNGCKSLDDKVPEGSRCISAKTSCVAQCSTKYKK